MRKSKDERRVRAKAILVSSLRNDDKFGREKTIAYLKREFGVEMIVEILDEIVEATR